MDAKVQPTAHVKKQKLPSQELKFQYIHKHMEINKPSKCLITKLKIYSHRPSDWLISILFFSTEDSILSLFHIEHLTYRLSHLQIEHMFTQSFKLSHLRIEHLFTQNLHFRLSHLHIEHLFKQNSRSSYYYSEHLFIQTLRLSHFHIEQKLTKKIGNIYQNSTLKKFTVMNHEPT